MLSQHLVVVVSELGWSALSERYPIYLLLTLLRIFVSQVLSLSCLDLLTLRNVLIVFVRYFPSDYMLLILLQNRFNLEAFLQIEEGSVFQTTVTDKVIELVSCLDDVQVQYIVESYYIFLFENSDVSINVKIFQMLLPLVKSDYSDDFTKDLLE